MIRRLAPLVLLVAIACSTTPEARPSLPPATARFSPTASAPPVSVSPLASTQPCPRPAGKQVHRDLGLAFGDGPVYAILTGAPQETKVGLVRYGGGQNDGTGYAVKVHWVWDSSYNEAVRVRARRIDAAGSLRFDAEPPVYASGSEVAFPAGKAVDSSGWHVWGALARFNAPGCYAFQIDGDGFSTTLRFEARP